MVEDDICPTKGPITCSFSSNTSGPRSYAASENDDGGQTQQRVDLWSFLVDVY